ncbi:hypothetical protein A4A49_55759, partial [Nicotiana attenuata]
MVDHNDNHYNTTSPLPTPTGGNPSMKDQEPKLYNHEIFSDLTEPINSTGYQNNPMPSVSDTNPKTITMPIDPTSQLPETFDYPNTSPFITNPKTDRNKKPKNGTKSQTPNLSNLHPATTGPPTSIMAGAGTPWSSPKLQFSPRRPTDLSNHTEPSPSGKGNSRSLKQGLGDAWSTNVVVSHGADPPSQHAPQQRSIYPGQDSADFQQYPVFPRPSSRGSLCNPPVHNTPTEVTPENFTFSAGEAAAITTREATSIASGEHLQRNFNSSGAIEEQRGASGPRNRQPSESGITVVGSSKGCGIQRGTQRDIDPTLPNDPSSLRNGLLIS